MNCHGQMDMILFSHSNCKTDSIFFLTVIIADLLPMMIRPVALQPPHFARELIPESSFSSCLPTIYHPMYDHDSNEMYAGMMTFKKNVANVQYYTYN